jgi:hypothetical protein
MDEVVSRSIFARHLGVLVFTFSHSPTNQCFSLFEYKREVQHIQIAIGTGDGLYETMLWQSDDIPSQLATLGPPSPSTIFTEFSCSFDDGDLHLINHGWNQSLITFVRMAPACLLGYQCHFLQA